MIMTMTHNIYSRWAFQVTLLLLGVVFAASAAAQEGQNPPPPPPPSENQAAPPPAQPTQLLSPQQLDQLVARIALDPDPLLAHILTASTFYEQIPEAAQWADEHGNIPRDQLPQAIREDNLPWDPSVLALLPFPSVLNMMTHDMNWTEQLGNAVLNQRPEVMDSVQRMRRQAYDYGYLRTNPYDRVVDSDGYVEIVPVNPAYLYVPTYDPVIVFARPRPGFVIGGAIRFGPAVVLGVGFAPWGWTHPYFGWRNHEIIIDETPWRRAWVNRGYYAHPYAHPYVRREGGRVERHERRH